jgi:hypothetical protein
LLRRRAAHVAQGSIGRLRSSGRRDTRFGTGGFVRGVAALCDVDVSGIARLKG